jgi:hypothetical protein
MLFFINNIKITKNYLLLLPFPNALARCASLKKTNEEMYTTGDTKCQYGCPLRHRRIDSEIGNSIAALKTGFWSFWQAKWSRSTIG